MDRVFYGTCPVIVMDDSRAPFRSLLRRFPSFSRRDVDGSAPDFVLTCFLSNSCWAIWLQFAIICQLLGFPLARGFLQCIDIKINHNVYVYAFWVFVSTSFGLWNWLHNKLWRFFSGGTQQVEQRVLLGPPIHIAGQFIATTSDINQKVVYKSRRSHWKWLIKADFEIKIISKTKPATSQMWPVSAGWWHSMLM